MGQSTEARYITNFFYRSEGHRVNLYELLSYGGEQ